MPERGPAAPHLSRDTLLDWDRRYLWHPFTPHSAYPHEAPLVVVGAEGHYLHDSDGRRLLDGVGSLWCNLLGHRKREIDRAIVDQLGRVAHATLLGNTCDAPIRLAKRLVELAPPGLAKVFFSDDGSTAVEIAVKIALQYWQQTPGGARRTRYLTMRGAYHGDTIGAVSVGGIDVFHERFGPLLFPTLRGPSLDQYRSGLDRAAFGEAYTASVLALVHRHADELAAVIVEPAMQGAAGMQLVPDGFLAALRAATRDTGTLLIADEVAMGMGRTGALVACAREGVTPDLLCLAKGLTGGYLPLAATLATDALYDAFLGAPELGRTFFHGHTYTGNALASAAALATLDCLERERVIEGVPAKAAHLARALAPVAELPHVGDVRQLGLAVGVELVRDRATKAPFPPAERRGMRASNAAQERGVFTRPLGDVCVLMPPLSITEDELDTLAIALEHGIRRATEL